MKRIILAAVFFVFLANEASAQYYNRMGGMGRMNRSMSQPTPRPQPEPKTPEDITAERLPVYVEEFGLDPFKSEVLRSYLNDYYDKVFRLQKNDALKGEDARKEYEFIEKEFKNNLSNILTEDQVNKFMAIDDFDKKKKKRKKKDKDN